MSVFNDIVDWLTGQKNTESKSSSDTKSVSAEQSGTEKVGTTDTLKESSASTGLKQNDTSTSKGTQSSKSLQDVFSDSTTNQSGTSATNTTAQTSALSTESLDALKAIVAQKAGTAGDGTYYGADTKAAAGVAGVGADALKNRVQTGGVDLASLLDSIDADARLKYKEGTGASLEQFAQNVGSKDNTLVQALKNKEARNFEVALAAQKSGIGLQVDAQNTSAATAATQAGAAATSALGGVDAGQSLALQDFLSSIGAEKGAVTSSTGTQNTSSTSASTTGARTSTSASGTTDTSQESEANKEAQQLSNSVDRTQAASYEKTISELMRVLSQHTDSTGDSSTSGTLADLIGALGSIGRR